MEQPLDLSSTTNPCKRHKTFTIDYLTSDIPFQSRSKPSFYSSLNPPLHPLENQHNYPIQTPFICSPPIPVRVFFANLFLFIYLFIF